MLRNDIIHMYMGELVFSTCIQYLRAEPGQVVTEAALRFLICGYGYQRLVLFFKNNIKSVLYCFFKHPLL